MLKSFTSWYALLLLFFLRVCFFNLTTLFSYTVFFCLFFLCVCVCISRCCCSRPCIFQLRHVRIFSLSVLSFHRSMFSSSSSSDGVYRGSHWLFQSSRFLTVTESLRNLKSQYITRRFCFFLSLIPRGSCDEQAQ